MATAKKMVWVCQGTGAPTLANFNLNETTDALEYLFQAEEAVTITKLGVRISANTSPPTYKISLQGVDASGNPDGTIKGGGTPASKTFTPASTGFQWFTLDNSYTCTRGEYLSVIVKYDSGTIGVGTNFSAFTSTSIASFAMPPYVIQNDATVRTKQTTAPCFGYASSSVAYGCPVTAVISSSFSSGSSPPERGNKFNFPTTWFSTYKISGIAWSGTLTAGTTYDVVLYDSDGSTVLQNTVGVDTDFDPSGASTRNRYVWFDETTLSTLNAGSNYYITIKPSATSLSMYGFTVATNTDLEAWPLGANVISSTRSGGTFTDSDVSRYEINFIIDDITAPAGGGIVGQYVKSGNIGTY
jgi:hypothetical protein